MGKVTNLFSSHADELRSSLDEESERPKVYERVFMEYDKNGEIICSYSSRSRSQNGSGFVLSYTEKISELILKVEQASVLRVFFYIAHHQHHELGGYRCSRKHLAEVLNLNAKTVYDALKWLQDHFIVNESRVDGQLEFMVNPAYVTVGADKKKRLQLWNSRWESHWKKKYADQIVK